jgi:hypothetical protein
MNSNRYMTGIGAQYAASYQPPMWLVEALDGGAYYRAEWKAADRAATAVLRNPESTTAEREAAEAGLRDVNRELDRLSRVALAALKRFDTLCYGNSLGADERRKLAAAAALRFHKQAAEAIETALAALEARDEAWDAAGKPGRDWRSLASSASSHANVGNLLRERISKFATGATQAVAEGEAVAHRVDESRVTSLSLDDRARSTRIAGF